jgi:hypothetical protein
MTAHLKLLLALCTLSWSCVDVGVGDMILRLSSLELMHRIFLASISADAAIDAAAVECTLTDNILHLPDTFHGHIHGSIHIISFRFVSFHFLFYCCDMTNIIR